MDRSFYCPITGELMREPVIDPEGNSYEKSAILEWLARNPISPITRNPLQPEDLVPNRALRDAIEEKTVNSDGIDGIDQVGEIEQGHSSSIRVEARENDLCGLEATWDALHHALSITIVPPTSNAQRSPADICCVVDVSGSMGCEASISGAAGDVESHGLSLLDVVKHAVNTVIHILGPEDRLSLVSFSSKAKTVFTSIKMDSDGKKLAFNYLKKLNPSGTTNLWDGLRVGMETLDRGKQPRRLSSILLLTDGAPNIEPPRGHIKTLRNYAKNLPRGQLPAVINTFGFGYELDSKLLCDLAIEGEGMYTFIPDSSFVGTAFVNCVSNTLATVGRNVHVSIESKPSLKLSSLGGHTMTTKKTGERVVLPGTIQFDQKKTIVIEVGAGAPQKEFQISLVMDTPTEKTDCASVHIVVDDALPNAVAEDALTEMEIQRCRLLAVEAIHKGMGVPENDTAGDPAAIPDAISSIKSSPAKSDPRIQGLLKDLEGQATEALSRDDWFMRWGRHYLPSLSRAHLLQQCNNFKDPGIQFYGGGLFEVLQDEADGVFCTLPAPEPSVPVHQHHSSRSISHPVAHSAPVSMRQYHDRNAPCIVGTCKVRMSDGSLRCVKDISPGDIVSVPLEDVKSARVVCVVKTLTKGVDIVTFEKGLQITPFHPVMIEENWAFPGYLGRPIVRDDDIPAVFDFVLDAGHVMLINDIPCVTFGHGFKGPVVEHEFFGTEKVIDDLKKMAGWETGRVELGPGCVVRDPSNRNIICGLQQP